MKKLKRIISLLLSVTVVISAAFGSGITSSAIVTLTEGDYEFAVYGRDTYLVYRYSGTEKELELPDSIYGSPVVGVYDNCFLGSELTSVSMPDAYEFIGESAFMNCKSLKTVKFSKGLSSAGDFAFAGCTSLSAADLSETKLKELPLAAFMGDIGLTSVKLPSSLEALGESSLSGCTSLSELTLPISLKSVGKKAFYNDSALEALYVPKSVSSVGEKAFEGVKGKLSCTESSYANTYFTQNEIESVRVSPRGDVNLDGVRDIRDVTAIQKYRVGLRTLDTLEELELSDVNGDGEITIRDATLIQIAILKNLEP